MQSAAPPTACGFNLRHYLAAAALFAATTLLFFWPLVRGQTFLTVKVRELLVYPWAGESYRHPTKVVGRPGDVPVAGDWNCDGISEIGFRRGDTFHLPSSPHGGGPVVVRFGAPGDTPLAGDWNGDGCDEIGVRHGTRFELRTSLTRGPSNVALNFGSANDRPIVGDWNGDRRDGVGVQRGNVFYLKSALTPGRPDRAFRFGDPGEPPIAGDWNGDGKDEVGVRSKAGFRLLVYLDDGSPASGFVPFDDPGRRPIAGDWDGDGADEAGASDGNHVTLLDAPDRRAATHIDQADSFYPWQVFMNRALRSGQLPLWNPYSFGGAPFLANGQSGVLYPPRVALSLFLPPERVHDVLVSTHMFLGALAMFLLLAYFRRSYPAALIGALAWMLNSFMLGWLALDHFVVVEAWLPIALLLTDAAVRRRSWTASFALALLLALIYLGGNLLFVELCFVILGFYGLVAFLRDTWRTRNAPPSEAGRLVLNTARLLAPFVLALALVAFSLLPSLQLIWTNGRSPLTYDLLRQFRVDPSDLANIFRPPPVAQRNVYNASLFLGTATAVLALIGCFRRNSLVNFMRWQALVALLFMLGTPVTRVVYSVLPGFNSFKPVGRAAWVFAFAVAILAAFGVDVVLPHLRRLSLRLPWGRAAAVAGVPALAALSIVWQMHTLARFWMPHQPDDPHFLYPRTPLVKELERAPNARIVSAYPAFTGSTTMVYPIRNGFGYESLLPSRTENLWRVVAGDRMTELASKPVIFAYRPMVAAQQLRLDLLGRVGVTDVVTPPRPSRDPAPAMKEHQLKLAYSGPDGRLYKVPNPLPPAYLVGGCELAPIPDLALSAFVDPRFDPRRAVILEQSFLPRGVSCRGPSAADPGSATVLRRSLNGLRIRVEASRPSWLVLTETWDDGWQATVDGRRAPVVPANYAFRAVRVPAGRHVVDFRYVPVGYSAGRNISIATFAFTIFLLGGSGLRRRVNGRKAQVRRRS